MDSKKFIDFLLNIEKYITFIKSIIALFLIRNFLFDKSGTTICIFNVNFLF